jgi:2-polyprenyl-3-methyl-5-hydroxy-6-metoxy-1,4-benzoquinol methylase
MSNHPTTQVSHNARTVRMYEGYARNYALLIGSLPDPDRRQWLERLSSEVGPGAQVLEVGSGTGCDADFLDSLGVTVHRTDATQAFVDIQAERGHHADLLNLITDELVEPGQGGYDAVLAMCVLIHVDRPLLPGVLAKIRAALRPQGLFLVNMREGEADRVSPTCFTSQWRPGEFEQLVIEAAFDIEGTGRYVDCDGDVWRTLLCRRGA